MAKRTRKGLGALIFIVLVAVLAAGYTAISKDRPLLGLDLQGGVSVVLKPKDAGVSSDTLDQAIKIIRNRVDSTGVAEPDISRQGNNILVQLPGVKDQDRVIQLVGSTAQLEFRPVLQVYPPPNSVSTDTKAPTDSTATTGTTAPTDSSVTTAPAAGATTIAPTTTAPATSTSQQGLAPSGMTGEGELAAGTQTPSTVTDSTAAPASTVAPGTTVAPSTSTPTATAPTTATTPPMSTEAELAAPDVATKNIVIPEIDRKTKAITAVYELGPQVVKGTAVETASASIDQTGKWQINPVFRDGKDGIDTFNAAARLCNPTPTPTCPTGALAVVLDNVVLTAPQIQTSSFSRDQIQITGSYTQTDAKDIALSLRYGALPVVLERQQTQIVSATLGRDALHAGLVAGLVGFFLVALYMIAFYRLLGVAAIGKLMIEGAVLWGFLCYSGAHIGLALTLAGITGIIVSIGVSLDSNVVYYEHLKEDVRAGRTIRASVDKSFVSAWSTILAADGASIIGAALLYFLTVGSVRGFAFYLGLSTVLDLITSYCYMRPTVRRLTQMPQCARHPGWFGLPEPAEEAPTTGGGRVVATAGRGA